MLEAGRLACVRGERTLFAGLEFALSEGEALRVAGANGAGKTSLLRILCALSSPEEGEVRWRGRGVRALREEYWRELVYIGHAPAVKDDLTAEENVRIACTLAGNRRSDGDVARALSDIGLAGCGHLPARSLSEGQRRRVALARLALSEGSPLWILDEPFTALDAVAVDTVRQLIARHTERRGMVVYTSHQDAALGERRIDLGAR